MMRKFFIDSLIKLAKKNNRIFLIVGDLGFSVVEKFKELFPKRFLNVGVAEQNMMGVASGIAAEGYHVFAYSIANFSTFRCAEQIRNDIDYHNLPVTIVSVGAGVSYGNLGYTHHALQDYSLMRSLPNTLILSPGEKNELEYCLKYICNKPQPSYLRIDNSNDIEIKTKIKKLYSGSWRMIKKEKKKGSILLTTWFSFKKSIRIK